MLLGEPALLDAQIEICDTLLDWGVAGDLDKFAKAGNGLRSGKDQPIWGLSQLRRILQPFVTAPPGAEDEDARKVRLERREKFFECDFKFTKSLRTQAQHPKTPDNQRQRFLEAGIKFIGGLVHLL